MEEYEENWWEHGSCASNLEMAHIYGRELWITRGVCASRGEVHF